MNLANHKAAFNSVGWFIPPYVTVAYLSMLKSAVDGGHIVDQKQLELALCPLFSPEHLGAMVTERYPFTPYVEEYKGIIAEAIEAHFLGLGHVAVAGLVIVIEGIGRKLLASRSLVAVSIREVFTTLAADCRDEVVQKKIGAIDEIVEMLDSFRVFTVKYLYVGSNNYPLSDNTNRHGILHGVFTDAEYGERIGFYKVLGALNFLCMVSALRASVSWLAPDPTERSSGLAVYYHSLMELARKRPRT